jgi:hypothetical protein
MGGELQVRGERSKVTIIQYFRLPGKKRAGRGRKGTVLGPSSSSRRYSRNRKAGFSASPNFDMQDSYPGVALRVSLAAYR